MGSILYYSNMTIFCLYLSFILAVTTAQKDGGQIPPPPPPGLCLDPRMMSAVCTINTEIGSKMEEAHLQCAAAAQVQERKKKKNNKKNKGKKGKGKRCNVDLDTLDEFFADVWQKKACILKKVGGVSQEGEIAADNIMAGIATLDPRLSEGLTQRIFVEQRLQMLLLRACSLEKTLSKLKYKLRMLLSPVMMIAKQKNLMRKRLQVLKRVLRSFPMLLVSMETL